MVAGTMAAEEMYRTDAPSRTHPAAMGVRARIVCVIRMLSAASAHGMKPASICARIPAEDAEVGV